MANSKYSFFLQKRIASRFGPLILIILPLFLSNSIFSQDSQIDSLYTLAENATDYEEKLSYLLQIANGYNPSNLEKAIEIGKEIKAIAAENSNLAFLGQSHLTIGRAFANMAQLDSALSYFRIANKYFHQSNDSAAIANAYSKFNYVFLYQGIYDSAIYYGFESVKIYEFYDNPVGLSVSYLNIASALEAQGNLPDALSYALKGLKAVEHLEDSPDLAKAFENVAFFYTRSENYDSAMYYINLTINAYQTVGDVVDRAIAFHSRGNIFKNIPNYDAAIADYEKARSLIKGLNINQLDAYLQQSLGYCYIQKGAYQKGIPLAKQGLVIQKNLGNIGGLDEPLNIISTAYKEIGKWDSAYHYLVEYINISDSLFQLESDQKMSEIRTEYETDKIATQNNILQQEKAQQRTFLIGAAIIILLVIILSINLFLNVNRRKKTNEVLTEQKTLIEQKNQQNEILLKEIHHRVKNNLQVISSLLRLQSSHISDSSVKRAVAAGEARVKSMALIHQKLYQRENLSGIEMKDYLSTLGNNLISTLGSKDHKISLEINMEELELDVDTAVPIGLITNEVITNSIKYAFPDDREGIIQASIKINTQGELELIIKDNGIGEADTSDDPESTAFGSRLIKLLSMQLGGSMETKIDNGRISTLTIQDFQTLS